MPIRLRVIPCQRPSLSLIRHSRNSADAAVFLAEDLEIEYLFCGAPTGSETCLLFCTDLLCLWLDSVQDDRQLDITRMFDKADEFVVLPQLHVAFLWECDH